MDEYRLCALTLSPTFKRSAVRARLSPPNNNPQSQIRVKAKKRMMTMKVALSASRCPRTTSQPRKNQRLCSTKGARLSVKGYEQMFRDDLSFAAQSIYRYLRYRQGKNENCFPSHKRIAADTKCSVSTVKRAINELVKAGYIEKIHRRRANGSKTTNLYICK